MGVCVCAHVHTCVFENHLATKVFIGTLSAIIYEMNVCNIIQMIIYRIAC